jgi:hypothetical protein
MTQPTLPTLFIPHGIETGTTLSIAPLGAIYVERNHAPPEVKLERACRPCRRNRQGAAVVEFAIVAPVFFMVVLGMIEIGRAVMVEQILTNAAREGARTAVLDGAIAGDVKTKVVDYMKNGGISAATADMVSLTPTDPATAANGTPVTVKVDVQFSKVTWLPCPWFISGSAHLTASSVMRREAVQ